MDEIEIEAFRADTKASKGITADHIAEAASLYDAEKNPAPLVFGHPTNDSPALGLVAGARADGNKLFLRLKNVADAVKTAVRERRVLNRSIAFWDPDHPSNPAPGKYSIRHLGLLGGMAPAIPGMEPLRFSADEGALEHPEPPEAAVVFQAEIAATPVAVITEPSPPPVQEPNMPTAEELAAEKSRADAAEARIKQLEEAEATRQREFAAAETARRASEDKATLDKAVADGKVMPAERDDWAKLFEALPCEQLTFAAGEMEPRKALASLIDKLPKRGPEIGNTQVSPTDPQFSASEAQAMADKALKEANERLRNAHKTPAA